MISKRFLSDGSRSKRSGSRIRDAKSGNSSSSNSNSNRGGFNKNQQKPLRWKQRRGRADEEIDSDEEEKLWERRDDDSNRRGQQQEQQQKQQEQEQRNRGKKRRSPNLMNDDDDDVDVGAGEEDGFFTAYTEEENRVKLVKQYLSKLDLEEENDEAKVHERLEREANQGNRQHHFQIADKLSNFCTSHFLRGHKDSPTCVAVPAHNSNIVYTGSKDCSIIQWNLQSNTKTLFPGYRSRSSSSSSLSASPSASSAAAAAAGHFRQVLDLAVSDDGNTLLSVGMDRVVRLWDVRSNGVKAVDELRGHSKAITGIQMDVSEGLRKFYTTSEDLSLRVWSLDCRSCLSTLYGHTSKICAIDSLPQTDRIATTAEDATVRLWKPSAETHQVFRSSSSVSAVDGVSLLSPSAFVSGNQQGSISVWSSGKKKPILTVNEAHGGNWITALSCIRYSDLFISGSDDGYIRLWKTTAAAGAGAGATREEKKRAAAGAAVKEIDFVSIPITGVVNKIVASADGQILYAAVGKEHKHGRWKNIREAKNGLLVVKLDYNS